MQKQQNQEHNNQTQQQQYDFTMTQGSQVSRCLYPSLLNKSSIHTYSQTNCNLNILPNIPANTQKLILTKNILKQFPIQLHCLKQVNLSDNSIEKIPMQINQISSLLILKMNNNKIITLPYLKYVRHLELYHNPIKVITTKLHETHLQYLVFDWIPYLTRPDNQRNQKQTVKILIELIKKTNIDEMQQFIQFDHLFQQNLAQTKYTINYYLHKAIFRSSQFFIEYLLNYHNDINYNQMTYLDRYILEQVLDQQFQPAYQLFTLKKSNLNEKQVFLINILLVCKYHHLQLFNFIVTGVFKRAYLLEKQQVIVQQILKNFNRNKCSGEMLRKILKFTNFSKDNPKKFVLPDDYTLKEGEAIAQALIYIFNNQDIKYTFIFQNKRNYIQNTYSLSITSDTDPLIHFAAINRKPQLIKLLIQNGFSVFMKDSEGKQAKKIRGSIASRKILLKAQKKQISYHLTLNNYSTQKQQQQHRHSTQQKNKFFQFIFNQPPSTTKSSRNKYKQSKNWINNLCSLKIHRLQNITAPIIHIGSPKRLNNNSPSKSIMHRLFIPNDDQSGVIFDYWFNYISHKNNTKNNSPYKHNNNTNNNNNNNRQQQQSRLLTINQHTIQDINQLTLYQRYHNQQLNSIQHDYKIDNNNINGNNSSIIKTKRTGLFSRLQICTEDQDMGDDHKKEYIVTIGAYQNNRFDDIGMVNQQEIMMMGNQ